jgi:hypothetical protein
VWFSQDEGLLRCVVGQSDHTTPALQKLERLPMPPVFHLQKVPELPTVTRIKEKLDLEYRAEFFNAFNHAQFMTPQGNVNSSTFGDVTAARDPRIIQMALKLAF